MAAASAMDAAGRHDEAEALRRSAEQLQAWSKALQQQLLAVQHQVRRTQRLLAATHGGPEQATLCIFTHLALLALRLECAS